MVCGFFQESDADRAVAGMERLEGGRLDGQRLDLFLNEWNTLVRRLVKLPSGEVSFMRFRDQASKLYRTSCDLHDFYFQLNQLTHGNPQMSHDGPCKVAHDAVLHMQAEELRKEAVSNDTKPMAK